MVNVTLHLGDCLSVLPTLAPQSMDAIITDLPYGTTACAWDTVIPFAPMWEQVKRILKPRGAFVTTASQPFTSALVMSNAEWFRYALVWDKKNSSSFLLANSQPLRRHEDICVFSGAAGNYNPVMCRGDYRKKGGAKQSELHHVHKITFSWSNLYFPTSILEFSNADKASKDHPTQKPVALYAYLIRTYTNAGDTVLDFCMGSGTTGVAAAKEGRNFVGVELDSGYFAIAQRRIADAAAQLPLFAVDEGSMGANEKPALAPALIQGEYPTLPA